MLAVPFSPACKPWKKVEERLPHEVAVPHLESGKLARDEEPHGAQRDDRQALRPGRRRIVPKELPRSSACSRGTRRRDPTLCAEDLRQRAAQRVLRLPAQHLPRAADVELLPVGPRARQPPPAAARASPACGAGSTPAFRAIRTWRAPPGRCATHPPPPVRLARAPARWGRDSPRRGRSPRRWRARPSRRWPGSAAGA